MSADTARMKQLADLIRRLSRDVPRMQSELAAARRELKRMNRKLKKEPCDA